jgi:hypothetical protein
VTGQANGGGRPVGGCDRPRWAGGAGVAGVALQAGRAEKRLVDRLRRRWSARGVARPVSPSRALAALASPATALTGCPGPGASPAALSTPYGGGVKRPAAPGGAGPTTRTPPVATTTTHLRRRR